jgi:hypothetical protein
MKNLEDFLFYFPSGMRSIFATGVVMIIEIIYILVIAICCWLAILAIR